MNKEPIILMRSHLAELNEVYECSKHFDVTNLRTECQNKLVIGRYSCLPYYRELEQDLHNLDSVLINNYEQHRWIADFEWCNALSYYTPETWFDCNFCDCSYEGPFVVKGATNSKKLLWDTHMFARTKRDAMIMATKLQQDSIIGGQDIVYRRYVPLKTFEIGLNGLPFTNEWRAFCYKDTLLSIGYYWSMADNVDYDVTDGALELIDELMQIACNYANFYVLDIAETVDGDWILIEVNDGQQSGLSENDPKVLYSNLGEALIGF